MDLEAIWHSHKPFIIKVGAGALVFLILMGIRSGAATGAADLARQNDRTQSALLDATSRLEGAEGLEKGRAEALESKLEPDLLRALSWRPDPDFLVPEGERAPLVYESSLTKALATITRHASRWNARVPRGATALGLPERATEETGAIALARADLVTRVVTKLLDAGVRTIASIQPEDPEYRARSSDGRALRILPIRVTFSASTELLAAVLAGFQVEGTFLEVRGCEAVRAGDGVEGALEVALTLQALALVDAAPAGAVRDGQDEPRGGRRAPRFGRER